MFVYIFFIKAGTQVIFPMGGEELRVNETEKVNISCVANGLPAPTISFLRGSIELIPTSFPLTLEEQEDGTYHVTGMFSLANVSEEDIGNVICQAMNTVEELNQTTTDNVTVSIIVNGKQSTIKQIH